MATETGSSKGHTRPIELRPADLARKRTGTVAVRGASGRPRLHTIQEWEALYPVIRQLYVTERRKLSDVMTILERLHDFRATVQMYKKRFTAWGLFKNRRSRSGVDVGLPKDCRSSQTAPEQLDPRFHAPSLLCKEMVANYPGECAVYNISSGANSNFDGTRWLWITQRSKGPVAGAPVTYTSTRMYQDFILSRALLVRGQGALAGMAVRKAFWQLEEVIQEGDPGMMRNLVDFFFFMIDSGQHDLVKQLMLQLARLTSHKLPALHPLARFFEQTSKNDGDLADLLGRSWRCFVALLHRRMGHSFYWMYENWAWETTVRSIDTSPRDDYKRMTEALLALSMRTEELEVEGLSRSHLQLLKSTEMMRNDGFYKSSASAILRAIEHISNGQDAPLDVKMGGYAESYLKTAKVKRAMDNGNWAEAEKIMRSDIQSLENVYGRGSREVIREMWSLEKVLNEAGAHDKASIVAEDAIDRAKDYLSDVGKYMDES
ncbi:hypothetical protein JX266_010696 [Neoarthrinium moseri]|nr:hypothetical protein JX266_010696 [Neoarthrinium moseri]